MILIPEADEQKRLITYSGVGATVDIRTMINSVYVAPKANKWFFEVVRSLVSLYGYEDLEVVYSSLDASPLF